MGPAHALYVAPVQGAVEVQHVLRCAAGRRVVPASYIINFLYLLNFKDRVKTEADVEHCVIYLDMSF